MNYYERYCGDYGRDTAHLSLTEHGAYTLLLDTYYATESGLPIEPAALYRICRAMSREEQTAVRAIADQYFYVAEDGLLHNMKADKVIAEALPRIAAAKVNGRSGGRPKLATLGSDSVPEQEPDGKPSKKPTGLPTGKPPDTRRQSSPTPITTSTTTTTPSLRSGNKTRPIPDGFAISDRVREWAATKGHDRLPARLEHFAGWARASGRKYVDWDEAFMNAIRGDWAKLDERRGGYQTRPPTLAEQRVANMNRITETANGRGHIEGTAERVDTGSVPALPDGLREQGGDDVGRRRS